MPSPHSNPLRFFIQYVNGVLGASFFGNLTTAAPLSSWPEVVNSSTNASKLSASKKTFFYFICVLFIYKSQNWDCGCHFKITDVINVQSSFWKSGAPSVLRLHKIFSIFFFIGFKFFNGIKGLLFYYVLIPMNFNLMFV